MTHRYKQAPKLSFCCCLALLLLTFACTRQMPDTRAADEAAIREADAQWSKTATAKDLDGTVAFYGDDATVLPPNAPVVTTKAGIRALWATLVAPAVDTSWQATKVEVARSGDLGFVLGTYVVTVKDAQGKLTTDNGKLLQALRSLGKAARRQVEVRGGHVQLGFAPGASAGERACDGKEEELRSPRASHRQTHGVRDFTDFRSAQGAERVARLNQTLFGNGRDFLSLDRRRIHQSRFAGRQGDVRRHFLFHRAGQWNDQYRLGPRVSRDGVR